MIVSELIEWLKTMPQDAVVQVLDHVTGGGYYDQGGNCYIEDFAIDIDYAQYKEEGDDTPVQYIYGKHFEFNVVNGIKYLQLGVKDK